jgi:hypothetical protein
MSERVFGLSANEVMAYTAVANVLLVVVLTAINIYYAWHAKRQADASRAQVEVSIRQAGIAEESLAILRKQMDQQHRSDLATVTLQLKVAIHAIDDWMKRIGGEGVLHLPEEIRIFPDDFSIAMHRANAIDEIVAENMGAAALYVVEAQTNLAILHDKTGQPLLDQKDIREKANKSLSIAKYKLNVARARWESASSHGS